MANREGPGTRLRYHLHRTCKRVTSEFNNVNDITHLSYLLNLNVRNIETTCFDPSRANVTVLAATNRSVRLLL
jgi:hypothetical protein